MGNLIPKYVTLEKMPKKDVIKLYDESAEHTVSSASFWLDEIIRKEQKEYNRSIRRYTIAIVFMTMTIIIMIATIINVIVSRWY